MAHARTGVRRCVLPICLGVMLAIPAMAADPPEHAASDTPDEDLLEFLGSTDTQTNDASWYDFLRATDTDKLTRRKARAVAQPENKK